MEHYTNFYFSKHLENIRGSDIPDGHALNNLLESLTEEVIELRQANKKQQNILNRVHKTLNNTGNFIQQLCYVNGQQQSYTASTNTYKRKKKNVYHTSEDNGKDSVCVKPGILRSQQLEESLKSNVVFLLINSNTGQYQLGMFLKRNTWKRTSQICRKLVLCRKVYIGS